MLTMVNYRRFYFLLVAVFTVGVLPSCPVLAGDMIELSLTGKTLEGMPIAWNEEKIHLLGRDGRLWDFAPSEASNVRKMSSPFRGYSPSELRAVLLGELGNDYEVSGTGHYLIAHPRDQRDQWPEHFEDLYRSFVHFFSVRGFNPKPLPFPLIGVVCRSQSDFMRISAAQGQPVGRGILGYYELITNRITLFDMGQANTARWKKNAAVLIHEATHQMAFNTGIHSRYHRPPLWVVEGLAMLFEAPGVYDSYNYTQPSDRVNRDRLAAFRKYVAPYHRPELIKAITASDEIFRLKTGAAYAEAWALTFFLIETEPRKYIDYLQCTAALAPFESDTPEQRVATFTAVFGSDWRMLEARFLRFIGGVK